jgi:hypothetical protein
MTDPRTLAALDLPPDATADRIASRMRDLAGLPAKPDTNVELWTRFLDAIEWPLTNNPDPRRDRGALANGIVSGAIVPPGRPDEDRFGTIPWDHELGVDYAGADNVLREFVIDEIAPRLDAAGLIRLI